MAFSATKDIGQWMRIKPQAIKSYTGYDGIPLVADLSKNLVQHMDLAEPQTFNATTYDWVMSVDVGENIPRQYERVYVENVVGAAREGVVVAWGHEVLPDFEYRNEKSREDVARMIEPYGFELDAEWTQRTRLSAAYFHHRKNLMVFRKHGDANNNDNAAELNQKEI
jgi:hypothetical protein